MHGNAVTFCEPYGPRELVSEDWLICQGWDWRLWIEAASAAEMSMCFESLVFSKEALKQGDKAVVEHPRNIPVF